MNTWVGATRMSEHFDALVLDNNRENVLPISRGVTDVWLLGKSAKPDKFPCASSPRLPPLLNPRSDFQLLEQGNAREIAHSFLCQKVGPSDTESSVSALRARHLVTRSSRVHLIIRLQ